MKGITDMYASFARVWANSHPIRSAAELEAAMRAAGLDYGDVTEDWLRTLNPGWVSHDAEDPFTDAATNRAYRRQLRELLA